jgi:hypothetical protein
VSDSKGGLDLMISGSNGGGVGVGNIVRKAKYKVPLPKGSGAFKKQEN